MDRITKREFEHVMRRILELEAKARNIPLRVGSGGSSQGGGAGNELRVVEVVSAGDNTISCDAVGGGSGPTVSKPYILRRDTYDTETIGGVEYEYVNAYTRTATKDMGEEEPDIVETQEIVPNYYAGEQILIVFIGDGLGWQDVNTAGRTWARVTGN